MAGMCSSRFVEPPNAAWTTIALRIAASVRMSRIVDAARFEAQQRRAPSAGPCRARSAGPTGRAPSAAATCPSASATTCAVAAVPRNWQPPPGDAQARQPSSAASSQRDLAVRVAGADRLHLAGVLAVARRQRHAARARARTAGRASPASAIIIAGRPLSQVATPSTPRARRQRADQPAEDDRRVVAVRQAVQHARRALRAAVARVGARRRRTGSPPSRLNSSAAASIEQADLPVPGVVAERDRRAVVGADAAVRARGSGTRGRRASAGSSPCRRSASARTGRRAGQSRSISSVSGSEPPRPRGVRADVEDGGVVRASKGLSATGHCQRASVSAAGRRRWHHACSMAGNNARPPFWMADKHPFPPTGSAQRLPARHVRRSIHT